MKKRLLALLLSATMLLALAACGPKNNAPDTSGETEAPAATPLPAPDLPGPGDYVPEEVGEGEAEFMLQVVHGDNTALIDYVVTDKEFLGEALEEGGYISGEEGAYGLFVTTVDGETADADQEQWWCLTKDGERVNTGVDSTPVEHGAIYTFTLTTGY